MYWNVGLRIKNKTFYNEFFLNLRLTDNETKTKLTIFADHVGMTIDPSGIVAGNENMTISDMQGIRLSPRQSPVYQTRVRIFY